MSAPEFSSADLVVCTECGEPVLVWATVNSAVCPKHCLDHIYRHQDGEGKRCIKCGQEPPMDYYDE